MIREEKNALVLVLLFGIGAFVLYVFVLRPAIDQAVVPVNATEGDLPLDPPPDPVLDQRPKSAKRMVTARALLRDAATGLPLTRVATKVIGVEDIAEPQTRDAGLGVYLIEYLPSDASFGIEFALEGYRGRALHQLRGTAKETLELGVVALTPERSVSGDARDGAGKPLAKVRVGAFVLPESAAGDDTFERCRQIAEAIRRPPAATGETDAEGRYRLGPLEPRRYALHFVSDGFVSTVLPRVDLQFSDVAAPIALDTAGSGRARFTFSDGKPAARSIVTLVEAAMPQDRPLSVAHVELSEDGIFAPRALPMVPHFVFVGGGGAGSCGFGPFVFPEDRQLKLDVPRGASLSGVVVDAFSVPIRGARVEARGATRGAFSTAAVTGADGAYRIDGLPIGACRIRTSARGFASDDQLVPVASFGAEHRAALYRGGVLEGTVLAGDKPLLGSRITVIGQDARAVTDERGRFRIEGLAAGPARVRCDSVGFSTLEQSIAISHGRSTEAKFAPTAGGEIRVRVLDSAEAPVRGARVAAYRVHGDAPDPGEVVFTDTDGAGYARLRDLENGARFVLYASAPGLAPTRGEPFELGAEHLKKGFAFQLERAASVTGRVIGKDGSPVARAAVRIESRRTDPFERFLVDRIVDRALTNAEGAFEFAAMPAGDFQVVVEAVGFRRAVYSKIPLAPGDRYTKVEVKLTPCAPVFGAVETDAERPAELARVFLAPPQKSGAPAAPGRDRIEATDFAGRFYFFSPDPGATTIHAFAEHVGEAALALDADSGPPPHRVVLEREAKER